MVKLEVKSVRKMAAILGQLRSVLLALAFLRAFTDCMCQFIQQNVSKGWDSVQVVPKCLKQQLLDIKFLF